MVIKETPAPEIPEPAVELAAGAISDVLAAAGGDMERAQVVEELNHELADSEVQVVDVAPNPTERRGRITKLTHDQLLDAIETTRHKNAIRAARALGRRAI